MGILLGNTGMEAEPRWARWDEARGGGGGDDVNVVNNKRPHHMGPCELLWKHWFWFRVRWESTEDFEQNESI